MDTTEREPFKCDRCGICCKNIKGIPECENLDNGHGVCKYYDDNKKECTIYEFRPEICNVEKLYKRYKKTMTWEQYLAANYEGCKILKEADKRKKGGVNLDDVEELF